MRIRGVVGVLVALQAAQWIAVAALARWTGVHDAGLVLTVLQVGVLLPVALVSVHAAAEAVFGARFGVVAAAVWALGPFAVVPLWDGRYRDTYTHGFLAPLAGLTHDPGFRAAVLLAAALALTALALGRQSLALAAAAGLVAGSAGWADSAAVIGVGVPVLGLLVARRPRLAAAAALATLPGDLALVLGGSALPSFPTRGSAWSHLDANVLGFQEYFWSMRLLEWLPVAGAIGLARRSLPVAGATLAIVAGWLIVEGSSVAAQFNQGTFLPLLLPAAPAYLLLAAGIVLLAPPLPVPRRWRQASAER